ncbi:MAG: hypothetical protein COS85_01925 [Armatimonadetes bacterium CG07_land_8_20_14_0_80_59_28]|nr:MAG: hypothetical protein COS85_01925 [Armatimonadetes bacterium CG07_land_8_20_14_0_80_59_28]
MEICGTTILQRTLRNKDGSDALHVAGRPEGTVAALSGDRAGEHVCQKLPPRGETEARDTFERRKNTSAFS